jgi:hypothetical protein
MTARPFGKVVRLFYQPPMRDETSLPQPPICRVLLNARELAYITGDHEITVQHLAAAIELDGCKIQHRYWRVMLMSADAETAWKAAIATAGGINKVTVQDLRAALTRSLFP